MKKNFLTATALMVIAFFAATSIAQAADVSFGGQMLMRYELNGQSDHNDETTMNDAMQSRIRLNSTIKINDETSAFIQMQSTRTWGEDPTTGTVAGTTSFGGSGNASATVSDTDASVGVHQAYFTLKNFASLPVDLRVGRQEIIFDGHRLFGNTIWTMGMQAHDAVRLDHKHGNHHLTYAYIIGADDEIGAANSINGNDIEVHALRANYQGILGGNLSVYGVATLDDCGATAAAAAAACSGQANDMYTIGFRQAGQLFGIDYRGEYYWQGGDARADATRNRVNLSYADTFTNVDRDAYMYGVRVGKKFNNVTMKPGITVWWDVLSGTDDGDINDNEWGTFNHLYDTGHKFYGLLDNFLNPINQNTQGLGFRDLALKGTLEPVPGWTLKADYHWFWTDTDPQDNPLARGPNVTVSTDSDLGTELDLSLAHKYNANTVITAGWSQFVGEELFNQQRGSSSDSNWAYLQFHIKY